MNEGARLLQTPAHVSSGSEPGGIAPFPNPAANCPNCRSSLGPGVATGGGVRGPCTPSDVLFGPSSRKFLKVSHPKRTLYSYYSVPE